MRNFRDSMSSVATASTRARWDHVDAPGEPLFGERIAERAYTYERYRG
jgi:hypothetical protein